MIDQAEFDEKYYLLKNPDVALAVDRGALPSGYEHFRLFGEKERRLFRRSLSQMNWENGFSNIRDRVAFYTAVEQLDFIQLISMPDYREALSNELLELHPQHILESLK